MIDFVRFEIAVFCPVACVPCAAYNGASAAVTACAAWSSGLNTGAVATVGLTAAGLRAGFGATGAAGFDFGAGVGCGVTVLVGTVVLPGVGASWAGFGAAFVTFGARSAGALRSPAALGFGTRVNAAELSGFVNAAARFAASALNAAEGFGLPRGRYGGAIYPNRFWPVVYGFTSAFVTAFGTAFGLETAWAIWVTGFGVAAVCPYAAGLLA